MANRKFTLDLVLVSLTLLLACNSPIKPEPKNANPNEQADISLKKKDLFAFGLETKLFLNAYFSECGEWGGHQEKMLIYIKGEVFYLNYREFEVDCKQAMFKNNRDSGQTLVFKKTLKLSDMMKTSVRDYINRLEKSKKDDEFPGHAGNTFNASKSDSTLSIAVYDMKQYDLDSYSQLKRELKLNRN